MRRTSTQSAEEVPTGGEYGDDNSTNSRSIVRWSDWNSASVVKGQQQQGPATLDDLTAEVRGLRADINRSLVRQFANSASDGTALVP